MYFSLSLQCTFGLVKFMWHLLCPLYIWEILVWLTSESSEQIFMHLNDVNIRSLQISLLSQHEGKAEGHIRCDTQWFLVSAKIWSRQIYPLRIADNQWGAKWFFPMFLWCCYTDFIRCFGLLVWGQKGLRAFSLYRDFVPQVRLRDCKTISVVVVFFFVHFVLREMAVSDSDLDVWLFIGRFKLFLGRERMNSYCIFIRQQMFELC